MKPTKETYSKLSKAYEHFNQALFNGKLPSCIITLQRKRGAYGYFWGNTWENASEGQHKDEIALNPNYFQSQSLKEILSVLVHEMCHLEQHHFGKPSRNGYHNKEWAEMMIKVGLIPSNTGKPGGKMKGQRMAHYTEVDGVFDKACDTLLQEGFILPWQARTQDKQSAEKTEASKTKYSCPSCGVNAWAKPSIALMCGNCVVSMVNEAEQPE